MLAYPSPSPLVVGQTDSFPNIKSRAHCLLFYGGHCQYPSGVSVKFLRRAREIRPNYKMRVLLINANTHPAERHIHTRR